jgi:hypothetical protein
MGVSVMACASIEFMLPHNALQRTNWQDAISRNVAPDSRLLSNRSGEDESCSEDA